MSHKIVDFEVSFPVTFEHDEEADSWRAIVDLNGGTRIIATGLTMESANADLHKKLKKWVRKMCW